VLQKVRKLEREIENFKRREQAAIEARAEILRLAQYQPTTLASSFAELLGDGGHSDETADEMIHTVRKWRDTPSS
jgi:phage tail tape-measure protein